MFISGTSKYAISLLRFGLSALFLWFGLSQFTNTAAWVVWVPEWAIGLAGMSETQIVLINGSLEIIGGVLLALGLWTKIIAFVLALHLFSLAWAIGLNDIGVRDFTLGCASLALSLFGPDRLTIDQAFNPSRI